MKKSTKYPIAAALKELRTDVAEDIRIVRSNTPKARLLLVVGPNSSGKSLILRFLAGQVRDVVREVFLVSMNGRTSPGFGRMIYGLGEDVFGTGVSSFNAVKGALSSALGRDHTTFIVLDEPDVGLSDEYVQDLAYRCIHALVDMGERCRGMAISSHNTAFLRALLSEAEARAVPIEEMVLGSPDHKSVREWIERTPVARNLDDLAEENIQRFRFISRLKNKPSR